MLSEREVSAAVGSTAYGTNGDKLGTVEHFFVDDRTGAPTWVSVITGLFGTRHSIVPAVDATFDGGSLHLPVTTDAVKSAPALAGEHLDPAEEAELRRHYGIQEAGAQDAGIQASGLREPGLPDREPAAGAPGWLPPVPPPTEHRHEDADLHRGPVDGGRRDDRPTDDLESTRVMAAPTQEIPVVPPPPADVEHGTEATDGAMTRSEERLVVGTERVATTRARLVKYVVTEEVQITVPIRREEIRVEEVPLDAPDPGPGESLLPADHLPAGDRARGGDYTPGEYDTGGYQVADGLPDEIVLHTERPVVSVEVVPVERVRLRTETVEGQERVTEQVQREQIVLDESPAPGVSPR